MYMYVFLLTALKILILILSKLFEKVKKYVLDIKHITTNLFKLNIVFTQKTAD